MKINSLGEKSVAWKPEIYLSSIHKILKYYSFRLLNNNVKYEFLFLYGNISSFDKI